MTIPTRTSSFVSPSYPRSFYRRTVLVQALEEEYPTFKKDSDDDEDEDDASRTSSKSSSTTNNSSSEKTSTTSNKSQNRGNLLQRLDRFGQSLKPRANHADLLATQETEKKSRKIGLKLKACFFWTLYMFYRGYRGFFVILPAVFQETYRKMQTTVDFRVLDDEDDYDNNITAALLGKDAGDINPKTGKVRWRTRITVSVLAAFVTMTYVVGGLVRVILKFAKTILRTSSLSGSFSAAADEVEENEGRLMKLGKSDDKHKGVINGKQSKDLGF